MKTFGVDVHGHRKGLHIAEIAWGATLCGPHTATFRHVPLAAAPPLYIEVLRPLVADGNVEKLAVETTPAAFHLGNLLLEIMGDAPAKTVAIDSPSGFARNSLGHGRLTEKLQAVNGFRKGFEISVQMTPSLGWRKPHGGRNWSWIIFGMAAFAALGGRLSAKQELDAWRAYLEEGPNGHEPVEAFPSATVQYIRQPRNGDALRMIHRLLEGMRPKAVQAEAPVLRVLNLIGAALRDGRKGIKGLRTDDRAAALIAALSTLPTVFPEQFSAMRMSVSGDCHGCNHRDSGRGREGAITLVAATRRERGKMLACRTEEPGPTCAQPRQKV